MESQPRQKPKRPSQSDVARDELTEWIRGRAHDGSDLLAASKMIGRYVAAAVREDRLRYEPRERSLWEMVFGRPA